MLRGTHTVNIKINANCFISLAGALDNVELGAAIRLLTRMVSTGKPVTLSRAKTISQLNNDQWDESGAEILSHFIVSDGTITHPEIANAALPPVATAARPRAGQTLDMPIVHPTKGHQVPSYVSRDRPELLSMKKTAYLMMADIFARSDQSENSARALLASLLKNWPEGDVYQAISHADKQKYLVNPRSWIIKHLQTHSTPVVAARSNRQTFPAPQAKARPRDLVTPEFTGVSSRTADNIRKRNAGLKLDLSRKD